jgi:hypothetical protein
VVEILEINDPDALVAFKAFLHTQGATLTDDRCVVHRGQVVATDVANVRFDRQGILYSLVVLKRVSFLPAPEELPIFH